MNIWIKYYGSFYKFALKYKNPANIKAYREHSPINVALCTF